ncbi:MAG: hypothetical protein ABR907_04230 [Terracidiphilus sp.]|jgi:hypothetical protein
MTTIQLTLPDQLAQDAQRAGLLSPESVEEWLRKQLMLFRAKSLKSILPVWAFLQLSFLVLTQGGLRLYSRPICRASLQTQLTMQ